MKRYSSLPDRQKYMKKVGRGSRFPYLRDEFYKAWVRARGCVLIGREVNHVCAGPVEFSHVFKTQGAGAPDKGEGVGMCKINGHDRQEGRTKAFEKETGVPVREIAKSLEADFDREFPDRESPVTVKEMAPNVGGLQGKPFTVCDCGEWRTITVVSGSVSVTKCMKCHKESA